MNFRLTHHLNDISHWARDKDLKCVEPPQSVSRYNYGKVGKGRNEYEKVTIDKPEVK